MNLPDFIEEISSFLQHEGIEPGAEAAVILGSGLGGFADEIDVIREIPYSSIPHFPETTVAGHSGSLICGVSAGKKIVAFSGRFHHYEGHSFERTVLPVQLASAFEVKKLIISNAAGGINEKFRVGDLMVIDDIIRQNIMITGSNSVPWRYNHYPQVEKVRQIATDLGIAIQRGTYLYVKGPNYETPAEIRAFRILGADAVGMSTAPELFEAARLGIKTTAVSLISNAASGVLLYANFNSSLTSRVSYLIHSILKYSRLTTHDSISN